MTVVDPGDSAAERILQLQRLSTTLGDVLVPADAVRLVTSAIRQALSAGAAMTWLLDEAEGDLVLAATDGYEGPALDGFQRIPLDAAIPASDAMRTLAPVLLVSRADRAARYPGVGDGSNATFHSWAAVPLLVERRAVGVLALSFPRERSFDAVDQALMTAMGSLCAQALARTRLIEAERVARARAEASERALLAQELELRTLYRLGAAFAKELDHVRLAQLITDEATAVIGAEAGALVFNERADDGLAPAHAVTGPAARTFPGFATAHTSPLFAATLRGGPAIRVGRLGSSDLGRGAEPGPLTSYLAVPVITRAGEVLGGLFFAHAAAEHFSEQHERMIVAVAAHAAVALENARLYRVVLDSEARARSAEQRKDEFLAILGHELRNPLAPISTALDIMRLKGGAFDKEREVIARQVDHMSRLVDDLLDVSRITSGKIDLDRRPVEIGSVIADAMEMVSPLIERRRHTVTFDVPPNGLTVHADPTRLSQVVANLLTNAAKYADAGGRISVAAGRERDEVVVRVADRGIGIRPDLLPHIFERFVQGDRALDRAEGGLGLGLTLVKSIVRLHDGTVAAHSDGPGRGSVFTVRLPWRAAAHEAPPSPRTPMPAHPDAGGRRILVVDDNVDAADVLAELLGDYGHRVVIAHDGPQALALAKVFQPQTALLDIGLPVMDGYELATRLRALYRDELRLIAVTGYGQEGDRQRALASGFDEHVVKPIKIDRLLSLLAPPT